MNENNVEIRDDYPQSSLTCDVEDHTDRELLVLVCDALDQCT
jgi:hypothetical protein